MGDITKGYTWLNGVTVTPARLHQMVDDATINAGAVTAAMLASTLDLSAKTITLPDGSVSAAKLAATMDLSAKTSIILPGEAINGRSAKTALVDADEMLVYDSESPGVKKITRPNLRTALLPAGSVLQMQYQEYKLATTISDVIPYDDTIPQVGEGFEVFSQAITPSSTSSKILVEWQLWAARDGTARCFITALFSNGAANAIAAISSGANNAARVPGQVVGCFLDAPATTSPTTYSLRVGPNSSTFELNGSGIERKFGGVGVCTFKVTEIKG